jgi:hypothetical protein
MQSIPYLSESALQDDIDYFIKKMGWTEKQLTDYVARPEIPHARFGTEKPLWDRLARVARRLNLAESRLTIAES